MKEIPLTQNQVALVDDEDYEFLLSLGSWCALKNGNTYYAVCGSRKKRILMHHAIFGTKQMVDHKDGNGLNNQRNNLRHCTNAQNQANRGPVVGKYKGVCWSKKAQKYQAAIRANREVVFLGYFKDEITAARAYDVAAKRIQGRFAKLNFPENEGF